MKRKSLYFLLFLFLCMLLITGVYATSEILSKNISYDNSSSGLNSTNAQDAIDELKGKYDVLNNHPNALYAGVTVATDSLGDKYYYFDGTDDYININGFTSSIDVADGFSIEFKGEWDALNSWSRIFDCGSGVGSYNILIANGSTDATFDFQIYNSSSSYVNISRASDITLGTVYTYKIICVKNSDDTFTYTVYKDGESVNTETISTAVLNTDRPLCYVGKSNWSGDSYFNGKIYYLRFDLADGTNVFYLSP